MHLKTNSFCFFVIVRDFSCMCGELPCEVIPMFVKIIVGRREWSLLVLMVLCECYCYYGM